MRVLDGRRTAIDLGDLLTGPAHIERRVAVGGRAVQELLEALTVGAVAENAVSSIVFTF